MTDIKMINGYPFVKYTCSSYSEADMIERIAASQSLMDARRSCRNFSDKPIPMELIQKIVMTASTAPSGANKQPWTFCIISDQTIKTRIRIAAEKEEKESYEGRMPEAWKKDLLPLQTDWKKEFLETAPFLVIVFRKSYDVDDKGNKTNTYYSHESCGIACGFLLAAIHQAGLVSLTHTPSPMNFLNSILSRPVNEKPFLVIPVGYPADECCVPDINRKPLNEVAVYF